MNNEKVNLWESLDRKQVIGTIIAFILLFSVGFAPAFPGLKPEAQRVLAIFLWFIACMVTDALPKAIIGLAAPTLLVVMANMKIPAAFGAFASNAFFLAIGAFIYAAIMMGTPLGRRIAIGITNTLRSTRVTRILTGLSLADVAIGGILPTVSETALFLPISKGVTGLMRGREHLPESKRINTAIILMITALVPLFTGPLILTSHFPNIMLAGNLANVKIQVSWVDWFIYNLPLWGLLPILLLYVTWYFKLKGLDIPGADEELPKMKAELGKITWPEIWAAACLILGLFLWITEGTLHNMKTGMVAIIVLMLAFLPFGKLNFEKMNQYIMWDIWLLLGGAICVGNALNNSGAVDWLAGFIVNPIKAAGILSPLAVLFIIVFGFHIARAGIVSAAAMGATFIPLTIGLAKELGFNILPFSLIVINSLSYAFFLPISITAFLIAWGASGTSTWEAIKFGSLLSVIANIYVILVQSAWMTLIGHPL
ncbi:MAG: hypothetical protein PWP65_654 [Clostridia bacterium]|nr:hypothetical protein [Clostridia bacterium]